MILLILVMCINDINDNDIIIINDNININELKWYY